MASACVKRQRGSASALLAQSDPSVRHARCIPSASTPWPAAKAATVPRGAPLLLPPPSATGTVGSAGEFRGVSLSHAVVGRIRRPLSACWLLLLLTGPRNALCWPQAMVGGLTGPFRLKVARQSLGGQVTICLRPGAALLPHGTPVWYEPRYRTWSTHDPALRFLSQDTL